MKLAIVVLIVFVSVVVAITWYLTPNDLSRCEMPSPGTCAPADAIVVVSGGDTNARVAHGVDLFMQGWGNRLVFSGAAADQTGLSNAQAMRLQAMRLGVSDGQIAIEEYSRTTSENAANTSEYFSRNNMNRIILVTSAYHQRRAYLEFNRYTNDQVQVLNSPVAEDRQWSWYWWLTPRGWWLAGSELVKIAIRYIYPEAS